MTKSCGQVWADETDELTDIFERRRRVACKYHTSRLLDRHDEPLRIDAVPIAPKAPSRRSPPSRPRSKRREPGIDFSMTRPRYRNHHDFNLEAIRSITSPIFSGALTS